MLTNCLYFYFESADAMQGAVVGRSVLRANVV